MSPLTGPYVRQAWVAGLVAYPINERKLGRWLSENAADDGSIEVGVNQLRGIAPVLGMSRDEIARAFTALRRQYGLAEIVAEAQHHEHKPRTYRLKMGASPVAYRKIEPMPVTSRPASMPRYRANQFGVLALIEVADERTDCDDEYNYDRAGSANDYDDEAA